MGKKSRVKAFESFTKQGEKEKADAIYKNNPDYATADGVTLNATTIETKPTGKKK